jgi:hypothetical protein
MNYLKVVRAKKKKCEKSPFFSHKYYKGSPAALAPSCAGTSWIQFNPGTFNSGAKASGKWQQFVSNYSTTSQTVAILKG